MGKKSRQKNHAIKVKEERPTGKVSRELCNIMAGYCEDIDWAQHEFEAGMTFLSRELVKFAGEKWTKDVRELIPLATTIETCNGVELGRIKTYMKVVCADFTIELERLARAWPKPA